MSLDDKVRNSIPVFDANAFFTEDQIIALNASNPRIYSWNNISAFFILSRECLLKYKYKINWHHASHGQVLDESIIEEIWNDPKIKPTRQIDWEHISYYQWKRISLDWLKKWHVKLYTDYTINVYCAVKETDIKKNIPLIDYVEHQIKQLR